MTVLSLPGPDERCRARLAAYWTELELTAGERATPTLVELRWEWLVACHQAWDQAQAATRGALFSPLGQARGAGRWDLQTGPAVRSIRYASAELCAWWYDDPRRRWTWPQWAARARGRPDPPSRATWLVELGRWSAHHERIR